MLWVLCREVVTTNTLGLMICCREVNSLFWVFGQHLSNTYYILSFYIGNKHDAKPTSGRSYIQHWWSWFRWTTNTQVCDDSVHHFSLMGMDLSLHAPSLLFTEVCHLLTVVSPSFSLSIIVRHNIPTNISLTQPLPPNSYFWSSSLTRLNLLLFSEPLLLSSSCRPYRCH